MRGYQANTEKIAYLRQARRGCKPRLRGLDIHNRHAKFTRMVRFCGVLTQIWFPTRGNQILLRSENALHLRSAFLTAPDQRKKGVKPDNFLKLNGSVKRTI